MNIETQGMKLFRVGAIFFLSTPTSQIKICLDEGPNLDSRDLDVYWNQGNLKRALFCFEKVN